MDKKELKESDKTPKQKEESKKEKTPGFSKELDFKKFLGCGG